MSSTVKLWLVRLLNLLSVALPILIGAGYIVLGVMFRDWGGPDTAEVTKEQNVFVCIGIALIVAALILPLKSKKRFCVSLAIVTIAMWYGILPGGQQDQFGAYILYVIIACSLYKLKKQINQAK